MHKLAKTGRGLAGGKLIASLFVTVAGAALSACGETYTWSNALGDGDWTKAGNFVVGACQNVAEGETSTVSPGADDQVYLPTNTTVTLVYDTTDATKKASCEAFAAVKSVRPYAYSSIDLTVPAGETIALNCSLARGTTSSNYNMGHLINSDRNDIRLI